MAPFARSLLWLPLVALPLASAPGVEDGGSLEGRVAAADAVVALEARRLLDAGAASVSVSLLVGDSVVSEAAFGHANVYARLPARPETLYNVASTFKPVTATAVLQLVERGLVVLESPVSTYLPELALQDSDGHPVTVRHLLDHTSAMTPVTTMVDLWGREAPDSLQEIAARLTVEGRPGERYEYSNAAFAVAGLLVERVSGREFEEYLLEAVLGPLGISDPPVRPTPAMVERLALPYEPGEDGVPIPVAQKRVDVFPAGDAYLTAGDLVRFVCVHVNGGRCGGATLLEPGSVARMRRAGLGQYGLGWGLLPDGDRALIAHGGGVPGYSSFVIGDPEARIAVAALATSGDLSRLARAALLELRGDRWVPPEERPVVEVPAEILAKYVGAYEVQPGVVLRVGLEDGALYVEDPGGRRLDLRASSPTTFFLVEVEGTLRFLREGGAVRALDLDPGGTARRID